ncbi:MAG: GIY-YIG nuclease family protein [Patescibacteria group bacterium]|nr:GIY-YIG nuclease family protein [Patescibacteria group bacterium]
MENNQPIIPLWRDHRFESDPRKINTNKPYWVYVIKNDENKHYIGLSENVLVRLDQHNQGLSKWTSKFKNWKIVYTKQFGNLTEARKWENYLKKQKGGNGFKKIIGP